MTCKQSEKCDNADICKYAKSDAYNILGGSCYRPKEPLTNEEYLRSCTTEQLAEFINYIAGQCSINKPCKLCTGWCHKDDVEKWLKQPHTIKE